LKTDLFREPNRPWYEFLAKCPFFNNLALPATAEILKKKYCRGDFEKCARYQLKKSGKEVPDNLWPDGKTA